jgi:hypothetical protein
VGTAAGRSTARLSLWSCADTSIHVTLELTTTTYLDPYRRCGTDVYVDRPGVRARAPRPAPVVPRRARDVDDDGREVAGADVSYGDGRAVVTWLACGKS